MAPLAQTETAAKLGDWFNARRGSFAMRTRRRVNGSSLWAMGVIASSAAMSGCFGCGGDDKGSVGEGPALSTSLTMHRLTRVEYSNTVRDLLGEAFPVGD